MRLRNEVLIVGVAAGLVLAAILIVAQPGARAPGEPPARGPASAEEARAASTPGSVEASAAGATQAPSNARTHAPAEIGDDAQLVDDAKRRREGKQREAQYLAEFQALRAEQGSEALERAVRTVLGSGREPLARRVAALRALHAAGAADADPVLASVIEGQPDVSDGASPSLPRAALQLLFERAPTLESARRVLARLAFVPSARVGAELRRVAATSLAASIHAGARGEAERLLRLEASGPELASALEALAQDAGFAAAERADLDGASRGGKPR